MAWWDGPSKYDGRTAAERQADWGRRQEERELERLAFERLRKLPRMSDGPRDVRRGDRWLPWHFREDAR